jgi:cell division protease FtsH
LKKFMRGSWVYLVIILVIILMATMFNPGTGEDKNITYSEFMDYMAEEKIAQVIVIERDLYGLLKESKLDENQFPKQYDFRTYVSGSLTEDLTQQAARLTGKRPEQVTTADYGFGITYEPVPETSWLVDFLPYLILLGLMAALLVYLMKQSQGGGKMMSFGKSRARISVDDKDAKKFKDVAGAEEEKNELAEIVDFLRTPRKYIELGARIPKGVLLVGPPGTGKTLLAKAAAGEAGVPFFSISGSDFVEMFVGVGASRVRDLFENAKRNAPCIVFIDEIDAVGRHRGAGMGGGHDEREQTLNQLLVEMDGFTQNEGIIIVAATNRPDILDPALLRPGRFDRQIHVGYPDIKGREEILEVHSAGKPLAEDVNLSTLAKRTPWFTGADLENVMNESAILAARHNQKQIGMEHIEEAITRVQIGTEKKSAVVTEKDKKMVAYHEAGHALVARLMPNCDPIHEISIIPRGPAGGYTMMLPKEDTRYRKKAKMLDDIAMAMGGRAAEKLRLDDISSGAKGDIKQASEMARQMVMEYGMSDAIGPVYLAGDQEVFLGKEFGHQKSYSENVAAQADAEIRRIVEEAYVRAETVLRENLDVLDQLAQALIEKEKVYADELDRLLEGKDSASSS